MPFRADRRTFLAASGRTILGASIFTHFVCRPGGAQDVATDQSGALHELIAHLEHKIPLALADNGVPGLSIALVRNARVAWRRGFGVADVASGSCATTVAWI